jgi:hypothetical protein
MSSNNGQQKDVLQHLYMCVAHMHQNGILAMHITRNNPSQCTFSRPLGVTALLTDASCYASLDLCLCVCV